MSRKNEPGKRAEKKGDDDSPDYVVTILVAPSPRMKERWKELIGNVNNNTGKIKDYERDVHFSLHPLDSRHRTIHEFADVPRSFPKDACIGRGDVALYDAIAEKIGNIQEYTNKKKIKDGKVCILVLSQGKNKASQNRSDKLEKLIKKSKDSGVEISFGYKSDLSEEVAKRIGADYRPIFSPPDPIFVE